jgi:hypothetical protein
LENQTADRAGEVRIAGGKASPLLFLREAARELVLRHDWVTLSINGMRYLETTPAPESVSEIL